MITFTQPLFLALLALVPVSVLIALPRLRRWSGKSGAHLAPTHAWAGLIIRTLLLLCVIFSLAGVEAVTFNNKLAVAFIIDVSDSMRASGRDAALQFVRDALRAMRADGNDASAVVVFGADAQVERSLSALNDLPALSAQVRTAGTDVESAVRLGLALLPSDHARRLVLLSDGQQTVGDTDAAARLARAVNAQLDVVPVTVKEGPDAAVERIDAPQRASIGQVIPLQVAVRSNAAMRAQLTVFSGPDIVTQQSVNLLIGLNDFSVRANATRPGFTEFKAQINAEIDTVAQNDALSASVIVVGPPRVLLVSAPPGAPLPGDKGVVVDETSSLKAAFDAAGILYDETTARSLPTEMQSLSSYQSIVMVNVPARELSPRSMLAIQSYVRDAGGGLVTIGGPSSYGVGGYFKTALEETLPVESQIKDPSRFPAVSMVIVMDKSGSMSAQENGVMKLRLAAEGAARAVELINDDDEITIMAYDTLPQDVIGPFSGRTRSQYLDKVLSIAPGGGGIYTNESLAKAQSIIASATRPTKFVILMADGNDAEHQDGAREVVKQMHANDVTVSVVAVGDGADVQFLQDLARLGGGRFHLTTKASNLPTIFTEETALAQRSYIIEEPFSAKAGVGSPIMSGITALPQLLGYVATTAKPAAQVILKANATDPLLATWQYGLGRVASFASDATGRWAKSWVAWPDFPKFWAQTVRWTILDRPDTGVDAHVTQHADLSLIEADLPPARLDDAQRASLSATLIDSAGKSTHLPMIETAPGHYEAPAYLNQPGAYFMRIESAIALSNTAATSDTVRAESTASGAVAEATFGIERTLAWVKPYSQEYAPTNNNGLAALDAWATLGGGARLNSPAQVFELNAPAAASRTELFPTLMALAALLLPFDIGVRRIAVSFRKLLGFGRLELATASIERSGRMSQLLQAKSRGSQMMEPASLFDRSPANTASRARQRSPLQTPAQTENYGMAHAQQAAVPEAPMQAGATAAELLRRRRRSDQPPDTKSNE